MVLLQWMGAVRMRVQTDDKNLTVIHDSKSSINAMWSKKLVENILMEFEVQIANNNRFVI